MSRRSSYGYSSYRSGSYGYGGYRRNRRGGGKKKIIIAAVCIVVAAAAAVGACAYLGVFNKEKKDKSETSAEQNSSSVSDVSKQEDKAQKEQSQKSEETSKQQSSEPKKELKGDYDGNVFIYDKQGYETFYGSEDTAKKYIETVKKAKSMLGNGVNVYSMVAPTHSLYGLPEKYRNNGNDQAENISYIYKQLGNDIKCIDVSDSLEKHKDEYIFFKTDHNWTALGAYYAYCDFCKAAGLEAAQMKDFSTGEIKNFTGSLAVATVSDKKPDGNKTLFGNPDTVKYYYMPGDYTCTALLSGNSEPDERSLLAVGVAQGKNAYSVFIWGNNPYMDVKTKKTTGKKLCIIKDSYGCAFAPFTVNNFDEVYIVDPTYYDGSIIDYIKKNKFTDVLFINSTMTANTQVRTEELQSIIK